jgi:hypothetical protein
VDQLNQEWSSNPLSACSINHWGWAYILVRQYLLVGKVHYPPINQGETMEE